MKIIHRIAHVSCGQFCSPPKKSLASGGAACKGHAGGITDIQMERYRYSAGTGWAVNSVFGEGGKIGSHFTAAI